MKGKSVAELHEDWQAKKARYEAMEREFLGTVGFPPARGPSVLSEEAINKMDQLKKDVEDAHKAWSDALRTMRTADEGS